MSANMSKEKLLPYMNFLDPDTITLQAGQLGRAFRIHRKLLEFKGKTVLECKGKTVALTFTRKFAEEQKGHYIFKDTSEGTLARFIEWAYTGDYPAVISALGPVKTSTKETESVIKEKNTVTTAKPDLTLENHPLLAHVHLNIFCSTYSIPDLQDLAFSRITDCFIDLMPNDPGAQVAVISTLRVSFGNLPTHDPLLDWIAQYAAYSIDNLRTQESLHDILKSSPIIASRIVLFMGPASLSPWKIKARK